MRYLVSFLAGLSPLIGRPASEARGTLSDTPVRGTILQGNFTQGGLLFGKTVPGATVLIDGREIRVSDNGDFLVGFGRDAKLQWQLTVQHPDGQIFDN